MCDYAHGINFRIITIIMSILSCADMAGYSSNSSLKLLTLTQMFSGNAVTQQPDTETVSFGYRKTT